MREKSGGKRKEKTKTQKENRSADPHNFPKKKKSRSQVKNTLHHVETFATNRSPFPKKLNTDATQEECPTPQ
jgi:hypothetical protein